MTDELTSAVPVIVGVMVAVSAADPIVGVAGAVVSITIASLSPMLLLFGKVVLVIALPAASTTVPIVKLLTVRSLLVSPAPTV